MAEKLVATFKLPEEYQHPDFEAGVYLGQAVLPHAGKFPNRAATKAPFMAGLIATLLGASVAAIGKEPTLLLIDILRKEIADFVPPPPTKNDLH